MMIGSDLNSPTSSDLNPNYLDQKLRSYLKLVITMQVTGLTLIVLTFVWIYKYLNGFDWSNLNSKFNYHPLLMIIGMVYLYGNAILIYRLFRNEAKYKLKVIHAIINFIVMIISWIALYCVVSFHNLKNIQNFYSFHSWLGLIILIAFNVQFFFGFVTFFFPGLVTFFFPGLSSNFRQFLLPFHVFAGLAIFISSAACCLIGLNEKAFFSLPSMIGPNQNPNAYSNLTGAGVIINFLGLFILLFVILIGWLVTDVHFKRKPFPEEVALRPDSVE